MFVVPQIRTNIKKIHTISAKEKFSQNQQKNSVFKKASKPVTFNIINSCKLILLSLFFFLVRICKFLLYIIFQPFIWFKINNQRRIILFTTSCTFFVLIFHLANLQILSENQSNKQVIDNSNAIPSSFLLFPTRGDIYIQDYSRNTNKIALTSTQLLANLAIDPFQIKTLLDKKVTNIDEISQSLAGSLNIPYDNVRNVITSETNKEKPLRYVVLQKFIDAKQKQIANSLVQKLDDKIAYNTWLRVENVMQRNYPYNNLLSSTIGYMVKYRVTPEEASQTECKSGIEEDARNGALSADYPIGYYGVEQKFCSLLSGRNGKAIYQTNQNDNLSIGVKNGSDLFLTLDYTIQNKAEEILAKAIKENTNNGKPPENGSIIVMEAKTGKILALASYPDFDPNKYSEADPEAFRNVATSLDYEIGSSMKPLTLAAALSEYEKGTKGTQGQKIGVPEDWKKRDYDTGGKIYRELDGNELKITNSQQLSYSNRENDLKMVIRDSINTLVSDIADSLGNNKLKEYFEEKLLFNKPTQAAFAGGGSGSTGSFESNLYCQYCYAQHAFGQGFYISPLQLMRAYTAIANDGYLVEPYLIDKIVKSDGTVDDGSDPNSPIHQNKPYQIYTKRSSQLVTEYMKSVIDEGFLNQTGGKYKIEGYSVAAKTGTAQISRTIDGKPCDYACNTAQGRFDHTLVGFGPATNAKIMVSVKLGSPRPGVVSNFADTTVMPAFKEMTKFSLEYYKIPHDR